MVSTLPVEPPLLELLELVEPPELLELLDPPELLEVLDPPELLELPELPVLLEPPLPEPQAASKAATSSANGRREQGPTRREGLGMVRPRGWSAGWYRSALPLS